MNAPRRVRAALSWLGTALLGAMLLSIAQVAVVRWVDPPVTFSMVGQAWDRRRAGGSLRWPSHQTLTLEQMGTALPRAAVSSEDATFWTHNGFDLDAIKAAAKHNHAGRGPMRGGSTITQQTARNVFLWQERSWLRKGLEAWYTVLLEALLPKRRILELYLNVAETCPDCFGVQAGSRHWFHKDAADLSDDEARRLVAILPSPRRWTPDGAQARKRAAWIARNPAPFPGDRQD